MIADVISPSERGGLVERVSADDAVTADYTALGTLERESVLGALRALPLRQREALVLRYYADLSEAEIAAAMGISQGAVKSHASRGMAALRQSLESLA